MKTKEYKISLFFRIVIYLALTAILTFIFYMVPYCIDAWKWGGPERIELAKKWYEGYNGRYLGNTLALIITRSNIAKTIVLVVFVLLVIYATEKIVSSNKRNTYLGVGMLLMSIYFIINIPLYIFEQTYGWPCASVNYIPPVALILFFYGKTNFIYGEEYKKSTVFENIYALPLAISTCLFSENDTILIVLYGLWVLLISLIKFKKINIYSCLSTAGYIAGTIIMFTNSAYVNAYTKSGKTYKKIETKNTEDIYKIFNDFIVNNLVLNNLLYVISISIVMGIIAILAKRNIIVKVVFIASLVAFSYLAYNHYNRRELIFSENVDVNLWIRTIASLGFLMLICLGAFIFMKGREKYDVIILTLMAIASVLPLIFARPIYPRCFYLSYIIQIVPIFIMTRYILRNVYGVDYISIIIFLILSVVVLYNIASVFSEVDEVSTKRKNLIKKAKTENLKALELPKLPHEEYFWKDYPQKPVWEKYYKEFYGIDQDVKLSFK